MMQVIKKWKIEAVSNDPKTKIVFFIFDNYYHNVLNKLKEFNFTFEPTKVEITEVIDFKQEAQLGVSHT